MKIVVLSDNRCLNDHLENEHGLCIYLETERYKCLLDTGASDKFIRNAEKLNVDLKAVDFVFISHGHADHIGGLTAFLKINDTAKIVLSKNALNQKFYSNRNGLHDISLKDDITEFVDRLILVENEMTFSNEIQVLNAKSNKYSKPKANVTLFKNAGNGLEPDDFNHELVISFGAKDLLVYTGCAHNGLLNILDTIDLFRSKKIKTVIGGFHLLDGNPEHEFETEIEIEAISNEIRIKYPHTNFVTGHCTGEKVYQQLKHQLNEQIQNFYTGFSINQNI